MEREKDKWHGILPFNQWREEVVEDMSNKHTLPNRLKCVFLMHPVRENMLHWTFCLTCLVMAIFCVEMMRMVERTVVREEKSHRCCTDIFVENVTEKPGLETSCWRTCWGMKRLKMENKDTKEMKLRCLLHRECRKAQHNYELNEDISEDYTTPRLVLFRCKMIVGVLNELLLVYNPPSTEDDDANLLIDEMVVWLWVWMFGLGLL